MITISEYQITPFLAEGYSLPDPNMNNGTNWLREAINLMYNRNKERLKVAGVQTNLFHNHDEQNGQTISRYPLILYQKRKDRYFVVGINEGVRTLAELFTGLDRPIRITDGLQTDLELVSEVSWPGIPTGCEYHYKITDWLPLNRDNYKVYNQTGSIIEKVSLLENILHNQIIKDFSNYLGLGFEKENSLVKITDIDSFTRSCVQLKVDKHIHDFKPFTISFVSNLPLPHFISLGNGKVYGFGLLEPAL